jgi:phytanoyl-CoA hydroxylase
VIDLEAYARDGFAIVPDYVPLDACQVLRVRAAELAASFQPVGSPTVFSTVDQAHASDRYFRESGGAIRFFVEPEAPGQINKIGHALHDLDPVFERFSRHPRLATLALSLGLEQPLLLQSMYLFKQPHVGAEVGWHQDATYLRTDPPSVTGFWIALDDADRDNGCLVALPGAHRGPLRQWFGYRDGELVTRTIDSTPWPPVEPVALEVRRGTLIVLHGLLPHASTANRSSRPRQAYSLHVIDGRADYPSDNWLQRPELPLRGFA